jgi:hypothetical protein
MTRTGVTSDRHCHDYEQDDAGGTDGNATGPGELVDGLVEDLEAVLAGGGGGQLAGAGEP